MLREERSATEKNTLAKASAAEEEEGGGRRRKGATTQNTAGKAAAVPGTADLLGVVASRQLLASAPQICIGGF